MHTPTTFWQLHPLAGWICCLYWIVMVASSFNELPRRLCFCSQLLQLVVCLEMERDLGQCQQAVGHNGGLLAAQYR